MENNLEKESYLVGYNGKAFKGTVLIKNRCGM